ncbi:hypothetical protein CEQ21_18060 [Niallia circulans]|uniref:Uncharacterized protein n=1 Tax=Niallia circulans TaxID=1397 RepID=A0A553SK76_NIACI|nr:hypothetical protein [Niallia circulans]TRZ37359.1 hypothetical protein CEQ21_18060 [Niallia circulans]
MILLFILLLLISFAAGWFNVPAVYVGITYIIFIFLFLYRAMYPFLFEKRVDKILQTLNNARNPQHQFLYYLFQDDLNKAEEQLQKIRSPQAAVGLRFLLLSKQERFTEAQELLPSLNNRKQKAYYSAAIALEFDDYKVYEQNKQQIHDDLLLFFLEVEMLAKKGQVHAAIKKLDEKIPSLKGLKLLSAVQEKKELEKKL